MPLILPSEDLKIRPEIRMRYSLLSIYHNRKKCVRRVVLPPSGVTALVEFGEPQEARSAFKRLAYTMFMDQPLYLEWAPVNVFSRDATTEESVRPPVEKDENSRLEAGPAVENAGDGASRKLDENSNTEPEDGSVLFVKNLNFSTTNKVLERVGLLGVKGQSLTSR